MTARFSISPCQIQVCLFISSGLTVLSVYISLFSSRFEASRSCSNTHESHPLWLCWVVHLLILYLWSSFCVSENVPLLHVNCSNPLKEREGNREPGGYKVFTWPTVALETL